MDNFDTSKLRFRTQRRLCLVDERNFLLSSEYRTPRIERHNTVCI
jgi:hypothetical protein